MKFKKILAIILSTVLILSIMPFGALTASAATSGTTGDCTWTIDGTVLTISGNGAMGAYYQQSAPWSSELTAQTIKKVVIENGVTNIGHGAFRGCISLASINIPNSVTTIGNYAFNGCNSLTSINIHNSIIKIGDHAFGYCSLLTNITVDVDNPNYSSLNGVLFNKTQTNLICCPTAKSGEYTIPDSVSNIGDSAFDGCSLLTSINIPDSVTSIGVSAFNGCSSLISIDIPDSVISTYQISFAFCSSLTSVNLPESITSIYPNAFRSCTSLTSIDIPNNVTTIGFEAFINCISLISIDIPNRVTSIDSFAFSGCKNLQNVYIPKSVTSIGNFAFNGCNNIENVYYEGTAEEWSNISFGSLNNNLTNAHITYNTVNSENTVTCIAISSTPNKKEYWYGEKLDLTGGKITVVYSDGSSETMDITTDMVSGYESRVTGTQTLTVAYNGFTAQFTVNVLARANPATSLILTDMHGNNRDSIGKFVGDTDYLYTKLLPEGSESESITWSTSDSSVVSVTSYGTYCYIRMQKAGTAVITSESKYGLTATCTVTVKEIPVERIELVSGTDYEHIENNNGYYSTDSRGNEFFRYNSYSYYYTDTIIQIVYKDGTSVTANVGDTVDGQYISVYDNQYYSHWTVGSDNSITINYWGFTCEMPITVKPNPVQRIDVVSNPIPEIIEYTNGYWSEYWNSEKQEYEAYYLYDYYNYLEDTQIKITYTDGTSKIVGFNDWVDGYGFTSSSEQSQYTPWTVGNNNYITISYFGRTAQLTVTIVESPVDYIVIDKVPTHQYTYGDFYYGTIMYSVESWYLRTLNIEGLEFTAYFKDGTVKKYTDKDINGERYGYDESLKDGSYFDLDFQDVVYESGEYTVTLSYMGKFAEYNITLLGSPVESIEIIEQPVFQYSKGFEPTFIGLKVRINYTDGTSEIAEITEENLFSYIDNYYVYEKNWYFDFNGYQGTIVDWLYDGTEYYMIYLGSVVQIPCNAPTDNKEIADVAIENYKGAKSDFDIKITYTDNTIQNLKYNFFSEFGEENVLNNGALYYYVFGITDDGILEYRIYAPESTEEKYVIEILGKTLEVPVNLEVENTVGDINGDGVCNSSDLELLRKVVLDNIIVDDDKFAVYDINADGVLDAKDLVTLKEQIKDSTVNLGDINSDGFIGVADLTMLRTALLSGAEAETYDVNGDGVFDARDTVALKKIVTALTIICGDVDGDGSIKASDLAILRNILLDTEIFDETETAVYDVNENDIVNAADLVRLKKQIAG